LALGVMKQLALLLLLFVSTTSFSGGFGSAEGKNSYGRRIHIDESSDGYVIWIPFNENGPPLEFQIQEECPGWDWEGKSFSCKPSGKSPLAGATYKITTSKKWQPCSGEPYFDKTPRQVYVCVSGCGPNAPKIFYVTPWEC
jgi:hypothetical protein